MYGIASISKLLDKAMGTPRSCSLLQWKLLMLSFLLFSLTAWGVSNILAKMKVTQFLRVGSKGIRSNPFSQMIACPACNGFWIGILFYAIGWQQIEVNIYCDWLLQGFLTSAICWNFYSIVNATSIYDH